MSIHVMYTYLNGGFHKEGTPKCIMTLVVGTPRKKPRTFWKPQYKYIYCLYVHINTYIYIEIYIYIYIYIYMYTCPTEPGAFQIGTRRDRPRRGSLVPPGLGRVGAWDDQKPWGSELLGCC